MSWKLARFCPTGSNSSEAILTLFSTSKEILYLIERDRKEKPVVHANYIEEEKGKCCVCA